MNTFVKKKNEITNHTSGGGDVKRRAKQARKNIFFDRITSIELILMDSNVDGNDVSLKADSSSEEVVKTSSRLVATVQ